jgi:hypothetical protein
MTGKIESENVEIHHPIRGDRLEILEEARSSRYEVSRLRRDQLSQPHLEGNSAVASVERWQPGGNLN